MSLSILFGGVSSILIGVEMDLFLLILKNVLFGDLFKVLGKEGMELWQKDVIFKELEN